MPVVVVASLTYRWELPFLINRKSGKGSEPLHPAAQLQRRDAAAAFCCLGGEARSSRWVELVRVMKISLGIIRLPTPLWTEEEVSTVYFCNAREASPTVSMCWPGPNETSPCETDLGLPKVGCHWLPLVSLELPARKRSILGRLEQKALRPAETVRFDIACSHTVL
jgi:hypothetical protein